MIELTPTDLLEPEKIYQSRLKDAFHDNAVEYMEQLTQKSGIDVEQNKSLIKDYNSKKNKYDKLDKLAKKNRSIRGLLIFLICLLVGATVALIIIFGVNKKQWGIAIGASSGILVAIVLLIILIVKKINKVIKDTTGELNKVKTKMDEIEKQAYDGLAPLFALFDFNMPLEIMNKTTPLLSLDQTFDPEKFSQLHDLYGLEEDESEDHSTLFVQSGSILGNPFVFQKTYVQTMQPHTYVGTLPITWTEKVKTENGWTTVTRTQVLTATYIAPEPAYYTDTWLIYGNEAAPDLSFSRTPTVNGMNDKQLEKHVHSFEKILDKKVSKGLKDSSGFTRLQNTKFEACFNALNRDNETQFRLLFTPLAQTNMVNLLTDNKIGYGDDFEFKKMKKLNFVRSEHLQGDDILDADPNRFVHFDYEYLKDGFISFVDQYCKSLFFGLAPIISIPLYQNLPAHKYIFKNDYPSNITKDEIEATANSYDEKLFASPEFDTSCILKSHFVSKKGNVDHVNIRAHSFTGIDRIQLVPTLGGDGKMHPVPVPWIEYEPVYTDTPFSIEKSKESYGEYLIKNEDSTLNYKKRFVSRIEK